MLQSYHLGSVPVCIVHCSGIRYYIFFNNFILFESKLYFQNCWKSVNVIVCVYTGSGVILDVEI
jgi:hypothetical protein